MLKGFNSAGMVRFRLFYRQESRSPKATRSECFHHPGCSVAQHMENEDSNFRLPLVVGVGHLGGWLEFLATFTLGNQEYVIKRNRCLSKIVYKAMMPVSEILVNQKSCDRHHILLYTSAVLPHSLIKLILLRPILMEQIHNGYSWC
jgi:hypothetical protein